MLSNGHNVVDLQYSNDLFTEKNGMNQISKDLLFKGKLSRFSFPNQFCHCIMGLYGWIYMNVLYLLPCSVENEWTSLRQSSQGS